MNTNLIQKAIDAIPEKALKFKDYYHVFYYYIFNPELTKFDSIELLFKKSNIKRYIPNGKDSLENLLKKHVVLYDITNYQSYSLYFKNFDCIISITFSNKHGISYVTNGDSFLNPSGADISVCYKKNKH